MKQFTPYDPEDIESLMLHKAFAELYPEEREFVLRHVGSEEEYESMRRLLHELMAGDPGAEWLEPDPGIREQLLRSFPASEKRGGFLVWLNGLLPASAAEPGLWYRRPAVQWAFGILIAGALTWVLWPSEPVMLAERKADEPARTEEKTADTLLPEAPAALTPAAVAEPGEAHGFAEIPETKSLQPAGVTELPATEEQSVEETRTGAAGVNDAALAAADHPGVLQDSKTVTAETAEKKAQAESVSPVLAESAASVRRGIRQQADNLQSASLESVSPLLDVLYTAR